MATSHAEAKRLGIYKARTRKDKTQARLDKQQAQKQLVTGKQNACRTKGANAFYGRTPDMFACVNHWCVSIPISSLIANFFPKIVEI